MTPPTVHHGDRAGAFVLTSTIALSLALSWASRTRATSAAICRAPTSRSRMFWYTLLGVTVSPSWPCRRWGCGGPPVFTDQTARVWTRLLGGGALGAFGLLAVPALAALGSNAMNDYSGSLALQTAGVRIPRPLPALAAVLGFPLVLWMHATDTTARFQNVLLFVGYWIPGFVAVVAVDWFARARARGGAPVDLATESTARGPGGPRPSRSAPPSPRRCRSWTPASRGPVARACTAPTSPTT